MTTATDKPTGRFTRIRRFTWRWTKRLAVAGLVLGLIVRLTMPIFMPAVISSALQSAGLGGNVRRVQFGFMTGRVELWDLTLTSIEDESLPALRVQSVHADLSMGALLTGSLHIQRLEIDGVDVYARRESDGAWSGFIDLSGLGASAPEPAEGHEQTEDATVEAEPFALATIINPPVAIDSMHIQGVQLHVTDEMATHPRDANRSIAVDLRVTDVGASRTRVALEVTAPRLADVVRFDLAMAPDADDESGITKVSGRFLAEGIRPDGLLDLVPALADRGMAADCDAIRAQLELSAEIQAVDDTDLALDARVDGVEIATDRNRVASIAHVGIIAERLFAGGAQGLQTTLRGVRATATRNPDGELLAAGFRFGPSRVPAQPLESSSGQPTAPSKQSGNVDTPATSIAGLTVEDIELTWTDLAVDPAVQDLAIHFQSLELGAIDFGGAAAETPLHATATIVGVAPAIEIVGAFAVPKAGRFESSLALSATELDLTPLSSYLVPAGIRPHTTKGSLRLESTFRQQAEAGGGLRLDVGLPLLEITEGDRRVTLHDTSLPDLLIGVGDTALRTERIHLGDLEIAIGRNPDGSWSVPMLDVGIATPRAARPPQSGATSTTAPPTPASSQNVNRRPAGLPHIAIESIKLGPWGVRIDDRMQDRVLDVTLEGQVANLELGGGTPQEAASIQLTASCPDTIDVIELSGQCTGKDTLGVAMDLRIRGIHTEPLLEWLDVREIGVVEGVGHSSLRADLALELTPDEGGATIGVEVRDVALEFESDGEPTFAIDRVSMPELKTGAGGTDLGAVELAGLRARASRTAEGVLRIGALELQGPPPGAPPATAEAAPPTPAHGVPAAEPAPAPAGPVLPRNLRYDRIALQDMKLRWTDASAATIGPFESTIGLDVVLDSFQPTVDTATLPFSVTLEATGLTGDLAIRGAASESGPRLDVAASLSGQGINLTPALAAYAPGSRSLIDDGRLSLELRAETTSGNPTRSARVAMTDLVWQDATGESTTWLGIGEASVLASEISANNILVDSIKLTGITARGFNAPGLSPEDAGGWSFVSGIVPAPPSSDAEADRTEEPQPTASKPSAEPAGRALAGSRTRLTDLPDVTIAELEITLDEFLMIDGTDERAQPLRASARIFSKEPLRLIDNDAERPPHQLLGIECRVDPLLDQLAANLDLSPLEEEPRFDLSWLATGIRGEELAKTHPNLAATIDAAELRNGQFGGSVRGILKARRVGPLDFALEDGFGIELEVTDLALRAEPDGPILAGIDNILVDVPRIAPTETGGTDIVVKTVDVRTPRLDVLKAPEGTTVAGILFKVPAESPATSATREEAPAADPPETAPPVAMETSTTTEPTAPINMFDLAEASIQGLDIRYRDTSVEPAVDIPLSDIEARVRGFTSGAATPTRPLEFEVFLRAGDVSLPEHLPDRGFLGSVASAALETVAGSEEREIEERPLFGEIALRGQFEMPPNEGPPPAIPSGEVRFNVSGFELTSLRGLAKQGNVSIADGVLDASIRTRLRGEQGTSVNSSIRFSTLSLSEPSGGPIARYLRLPQATSAVLALLRNSSGEQRIPLSFDVGTNGMSTAAISSAAVNAFGSIVTNAITNAPLRAASTLTDLIPIDFGKEDLSKYKAAVEFPVGSTGVPGLALESLTPLANKLAGDDELVLVVEHDLSLGDQALVERRANPSRADCEALVNRLRARNIELARRRPELVAEARALYIVGNRDGARAVRDRLITMDREYAENEHGLDDLLSLLQPGSERRRPARTRIALQEIANTRLSAVQRVLVQTQASIEPRIELRRPRGRVVEELDPNLGGRVRLEIRRRRDS